MRANQDVQTLEIVPLFDSLAASEREKIERCCSWRSFNAGEMVLTYLDQTDEVYFVIQGTAKVIIYSSQGRAVDFRELRSGDIFGEFSAIDGDSRSASIEAETSCMLAVMSAQNFRRIITEDPDVSRSLVLHLVKRLRALSQRVYELSTLAVNNRIEVELLRLARGDAPATAMDDGGVQITPAPTHAAIAARISTHREAVSRHLSKLAKQGVIERKGRSLIVRNVRLLEAMVRTATGEESGSS